MKPFILLSFIMSACGNPGDRLKDEYTWDRELVPILHEFIDRLAVPEDRVINLWVLDQKVDPADEDGILGYCQWLGDASVVYIEKRLHPTVKHFVTMHELGHCLLNLDHDDTSTIMNTYTDPAAAEQMDDGQKESFYQELENLVKVQHGE